MRDSSARLFHVYNEKSRFWARTDGGHRHRNWRCGTVNVMATADHVVSPVELDDVHERSVSAGNQCDQSDPNDGHVFGHGPTAHALPSARRPATDLTLLRVVRTHVVVRGMEFAVGVQAVFGPRVRVGHFVIVVVVFPECEQMDDRRTHQPEDGEKYSTDERDERCQVRYESGYEHCTTGRKKKTEKNTTRD